MMNINTEEFNPKIMFHYKEKASYEVSEHTHDFLTIQYVVSGRLTYYVNGQEIEAKIVDFNEEDKKISLSMKSLIPEEPEAEEVAVETEETVEEVNETSVEEASVEE